MVMKMNAKATKKPAKIELEARESQHPLQESFCNTFHTKTLFQEPDLIPNLTPQKTSETGSKHNRNFKFRDPQIPKTVLELFH